MMMEFFIHSLGICIFKNCSLGFFVSWILFLFYWVEFLMCLPLWQWDLGEQSLKMRWTEVSRTALVNFIQSIRHFILWGLGKVTWRGWWGGSVVNSTCCSCWGSRFTSQHSRGGSQPSITPVPGIWCPLLISVGTTHSWHTLRQTHLKSMIGRQWGQTSVGCISSFSNTITELFYVWYLSFLGSCDSRISTSCQPQNLFFKFTPESIYPYSCLQG